MQYTYINEKLTVLHLYIRIPAAHPRFYMIHEFRDIIQLKQIFVYLIPIYIHVYFNITTKTTRLLIICFVYYVVMYIKNVPNQKIQLY